jgi:hypothetical protein
MWELMNKQACGESENAALYMIKDGDSGGEGTHRPNHARA